MTRVRPLFKRFRYRERPQKNFEIVDEHMDLPAYRVCIERAARYPRPLDCALPLFYLLLAGPALVVKLDGMFR